MCSTCKITKLDEIVDPWGNFTWYVCYNCNPKGTRDECEAGLFYKCAKCEDPVPYGIDKEYTCSTCDAITCLGCVVWNDDDDDDYGDDEGVTFCSQECLDKHHKKKRKKNGEEDEEDEDDDADADD